MKNQNQNKVTKDLINQIGQNLSTVCFTKPAANDGALNTQNYEEMILEGISDIYSALKDPYQIRQRLRYMNQLIQLHVPLDIRPNLFRQLNSVTGTLMTAYLTDNEIYDLCFKIMTTFKAHIDNQEQRDARLNEMEWEELEKSVYLLCDWEDQVNLGVTSAVTQELRDQY